MRSLALFVLLLVTSSVSAADFTLYRANSDGTLYKMRQWKDVRNAPSTKTEGNAIVYQVSNKAGEVIQVTVPQTGEFIVVYE